MEWLLSLSLVKDSCTLSGVSGLFLSIAAWFAVVYPVTRWGTLRVFPVWGCYKKKLPWAFGTGINRVLNTKSQLLLLVTLPTIGFIFKLFIYLLRRTACGISFPDQGWNPRPLQWQHGVLTAAPPGKALHLLLA